MASKGPAKARHGRGVMVKILLYIGIAVLEGLIVGVFLGLGLGGCDFMFKAVVAPPSARQGDLWGAAGMLAAWAVLVVASASYTKKTTGRWSLLLPPRSVFRMAQGRKGRNRDRGATY